MIRPFILIALLASPAAAQPACGPRDALVIHLERKYGETRRMFGIQSGRAIVETYASASGSWTVLMTNTDGVACVVASGEAFQAFPAAVQDERL